MPVTVGVMLNYRNVFCLLIRVRASDGVVGNTSAGPTLMVTF